jgi:hypothetical protein
LSDKTGIQIASILDNGNIPLKELGLKWNKLSAISGNQIANALKNNISLRVLDLSWNMLGVKPPDQIDRLTKKTIKIMSPGDIGRAWGMCFLDNRTLIHVDMSFNKFNTEDTEALTADLQFN